MSIFSNIKDWYDEHKTVVKAVGIGLGGAAIGGLAIYAGYKANEAKNTKPTTIPQLASDDEVKQVHDDILTRNWKESYRENWDKVNAFAKTLELEDGEEYYITGPNTWAGQTDKVVVSHLIYGDCAYPPEDDNDDKEATTNDSDGAE